MLAIVTVSSDEFVEGTIVLFKSILLNNRSFKGDFLVIDAGISHENKEVISDLFPCKFIEPSSLLKDKIGSLINSCPKYSKTSKRFYSLEIFNLTNYSKVLYLDSDILCVGNIKELFDVNEAISAVADFRYYRGFIRERNSLKPVFPNKYSKLFPEAFIPKLFNTGMILINSKLLNKSYLDLVDNLTFDNFEKIKTGHTDTVVLNKLFLKDLNWLPLKWNAFTELDISELKEIKFIHYLRKNKPWNIKDFNKASKEQKLWIEISKCE